MSVPNMHRTRHVSSHPRRGKYVVKGVDIMVLLAALLAAFIVIVAQQL